MDNHAMIEADRLSKRYEDGTRALEDVTFSVTPGEIFVMLGANGAGKTTAINLFLNFIDPTGGEARIGGIATHRDPLEAKRHVAYVSENVTLYPNFTALQNLEYFARLGGKNHLAREDYRRVLARVGLQDGAHEKRLRTFSKGMRQKCGIAIAILKDAPAILLDEPTAGLDPQAAYEFQRLLETLRDEGKAILMSTHDIFRAREVSDTIGILNSGRLVMKESTRDLAGEDLEQLYLQHMAGHRAPSLALTTTENGV